MRSHAKEGPAARRLPPACRVRVRARVTLLSAQLEDRAAAGVEEAPQLAERRRVDEVLGVAERDSGLAHGLQHRVAVLERSGQHLVARITGAAEPAGQRLLDDHVLAGLDRKSTRLNSSHSQISYAVFCLKKK